MSVSPKYFQKINIGLVGAAYKIQLAFIIIITKNKYMQDVWLSSTFQ